MVCCFPAHHENRKIPQGFRYDEVYYRWIFFDRRKIMPCISEPRYFPKLQIIHPMKDSELDQLLRAANATAPVPAGFERDVWSRIEALESDRGWFCVSLERFLGFFALPSVAAVTCAVTVMCGVWLGLNSQVSNQSGDVAYLQSISPFAHNRR